MLLVRCLRNSARRFHLGVSARCAADKEEVSEFRLPEEAKQEFYNPAERYQPTPLLKEKVRVCASLPVKIKVKKGQSLLWCSCGFSGDQPLCNGYHRLQQFNTRRRPVRYVADSDKEVWFCMCKQTKHPPFCDGSHRNLDILLNSDD